MYVYGSGLIHVGSWSLWPVSLPESASSTFSERSYLRNTIEDTGSWPLAYTHMFSYTCAHSYGHVYTPQAQREEEKEGKIKAKQNKSPRTAWARVSSNQPGQLCETLSHKLKSKFAIALERIKQECYCKLEGQIGLHSEFRTNCNCMRPSHEYSKAMNKRDVSAISSTCCSYRKPEFVSQYPRYESQLLITPVPGYPLLT